VVDVCGTIRILSHAHSLDGLSECTAMGCEVQLNSWPIGCQSCDVQVLSDGVGVFGVSW
jgi:hypothetical protein